MRDRLVIRIGLIVLGLVAGFSLVAYVPFTDGKQPPKPETSPPAQVDKQGQGTAQAVSIYWVDDKIKQYEVRAYRDQNETYELAGDTAIEAYDLRVVAGPSKQLFDALDAADVCQGNNYSEFGAPPAANVQVDPNERMVISIACSDGETRHLNVYDESARLGLTEQDIAAIREAALTILQPAREHAQKVLGDLA